ncbi:MAG: hypothetical protein HOG79_00435, partial [Prolixibacteraceae bacterium]|nr:hypothetical protein [Prolixibacteraceae bacterium]
MFDISPRELFFALFNSGTEQEVEKLFSKVDLLNNLENWRPLGGNASNYGVIENQQSSPIAALIEKITNSIDAILTKRCLEHNIDPRSLDAPRTMSDAISRFFPEHKDWDLKSFRRNQSEDIQIIADGKPKNTSVVIYDNGEGQHPEEF